MRRMLSHLLIASAALVAAPTHALIDAPRIEFEVRPELSDVFVMFFDQNGQPAPQLVPVGLRGTLTLGQRIGPTDPALPEDTLIGKARASIFAPDIIDFNLELTTPVSAASQQFSFKFTPATATIEIPGPGVFTDGQSIIIDTSGLLAATTILQLVTDNFSPIDLVELDEDSGDVGNDPLVSDNSSTNDLVDLNQGFGFDGNDTLVAALVSGSVNLGVAALPGGFGNPPLGVSFGQLTSANLFTLADVVAPVPLPASVLPLTAACGLLLRCAGRRRP